MDVREVRLFPNSNTCSLLSCGTWKEVQYFISCFHICPKERFLSASPEWEHDYQCVCVCACKKERLRGHITWKQRLWRVIGEEGSPKLERVHTPFSVCFLILIVLFPKWRHHPGPFPNTPLFPPSIHTHSLWKSSTSAWMTLDQAIPVSSLPNL